MWEGVEWNQVNLARRLLQNLSKLLGLFWFVVNAFHQVILNSALRRSGSFCKYPLTEANNSLMGYFLLIGTSSLRNASFGACNDTANETSITSPSLSSIGTTPDVLSVTRRLDKP